MESEEGYRLTSAAESADAGLRTGIPSVSNSSNTSNCMSISPSRLRPLRITASKPSNGVPPGQKARAPPPR